MGWRLPPGGKRQPTAASLRITNKISGIFSLKFKLQQITTTFKTMFKPYRSLSIFSIDERVISFTLILLKKRILKHKEFLTSDSLDQFFSNACS